MNLIYRFILILYNKINIKKMIILIKLIIKYRKIDINFILIIIFLVVIK